MPRRKKTRKKTDPLNIIDLNKVYRTLDLSGKNLTELSAVISDYRDLRIIRLTSNSLTRLPETIGELANLTGLYVNFNYLVNFPDSIIQLTNLKILYANNNCLIRLPADIGNLNRLECLNLSFNKLEFLPDSIGDLEQLVQLDLSSNSFTSLPASMARLVNLSHLFLSGNPLLDLSGLRVIPNLHYVEFKGVTLLSRYWCKLTDWQLQWSIEEKDPQLRQMLISHFGYQQIWDGLNLPSIDEWREYNLLKLDNVEQMYDENGDLIPESKPIALLKTICLSTEHVRIVRVPPEIESAEAAITWVNHGIHPDLLTHEERESISIPQGNWQIRFQREYVPQDLRYMRN